MTRTKTELNGGTKARKRVKVSFWFSMRSHDIQREDMFSWKDFRPSRTFNIYPFMWIVFVKMPSAHINFRIQESKIPRCVTSKSHNFYYVIVIFYFHLFLIFFSFLIILSQIFFPFKSEFVQIQVGSTHLYLLALFQFSLILINNY